MFHKLSTAALISRRRRALHLSTRSSLVVVAVVVALESVATPVVWAVVVPVVFRKVLI